MRRKPASVGAPAPGTLVEVLVGATSREDVLRAPHRATRAVVDQEGHPFARQLYTAFDSFNRQHWAGRLAAPLVLITNTASPRALGDQQTRDPHGLRSIIRIHPRTADRGVLFARDVLLHEMIHVWQSEIVQTEETGYRGHGPLFAGECNRIGAALGLADVAVKGRKGLPNCAQWPLCVRPRGFYGNAAAERERVKRAPGPRRDRADADDVAEDLGAQGKLDAEGAAFVCELAADVAEGSGAPAADVSALRRSANYLRQLADAAEDQAGD